jgi:metal transporter CNNM
MGPFETKEDEINASYARKILPLRKRGNLLICTILLGNVAVNSILSILMADLTSGLAGMLISTGIILMFGEIIP